MQLMGKGNGRIHNEPRTARSGGALLGTRVQGRLYNDNGNAIVYEIGPMISVSLFKGAMTGLAYVRTPV